MLKILHLHFYALVIELFLHYVYNLGKDNFFCGAYGKEFWWLLWLAGKLIICGSGLRGSRWVKGNFILVNFLAGN